MRRQEGTDIDPTLAARVAALSPGGQKWLKTAIQTIRTLQDIDEEAAPQVRTREPEEPSPPKEVPPPGLEDVITGRVDLKDLESYPELDKELEGLGEIIDMLRGLGESRRKRGEDILREDILGQPREGEEHPQEADDEDFSF
jgi:hypothetical protein